MCQKKKSKITSIISLSSIPLLTQLINKRENCGDTIYSRDKGYNRKLNKDLISMKTLVDFLNMCAIILTRTWKRTGLVIKKYATLADAKVYSWSWHPSYKVIVDFGNHVKAIQNTELKPADHTINLTSKFRQINKKSLIIK